MDLVGRLAIDLACMFVLVRVIYFRAHRRTDLFLSFFSFNLVIFLIGFVLTSTDISMGAAFGLFAVFSMLRYRTEGISTTDMTYLFLGVALGLIMAVAAVPTVGLLAIGLTVLGFTALLEGGAFSGRETGQEILYDRIDLVHTGRKAELIADLKARTGLDVLRVDVREIDLVRDMARLTVYHSRSRGGMAEADSKGVDAAGQLKVASAA